MFRITEISFKRKLISLVMTVGGVSLILAFTAFLIYDHIHTKKQLVRDLGILAEMTGSNCSASVLFSVVSDAEEMISALKAHPDIRCGFIFTSDGREFTSYYRSRTDSLTSRNFIHDLIRDLSKENQRKTEPQLLSFFRSDHSLFSKDCLAVLHPIVLDQEVIGAVYLESDLSVLKERFHKSINLFIIVMVCTFTVMILLTLRLQNFLTKPILYLSALAKQVSAEKDYSLRAHPFSKDEIGSLINSFNDMLTQIEIRDNTIQDTSHLLEKQARLMKSELKERKKVEKEIKRNLEEKDILLQEIHHRVKNNLQIISSLLKLQIQSIADPGTLTLFQDCHNRVYTMSLIHDQLYHSKDFSNINLSEYVLSLTKYLFHIYNDPARQVDLEIKMDQVHIGLNDAIPCGLLINELVSNSLKYAFKARTMGHILISMAQSDNTENESNKFKKYVLIVKDDGIGIPPEIDLSNTDSLGLKLVYALTRQLHGEVVIEREGGTCFRFVFNLLS